jgi:hypothetical protein
MVGSAGTSINKLVLKYLIKISVISEDTTYAFLSCSRCVIQNKDVAGIDIRYMQVDND